MKREVVFNQKDKVNIEDAHKNKLYYMVAKSGYCYLLYEFNNVWVWKPCYSTTGYWESNEYNNYKDALVGAHSHGCSVFELDNIRDLVSSQD
jgi:hypothetical protein